MSGESVKKRKIPHYVGLAKKLQEQIARGKYPVGSQMPPELEIAEAHKVAYLTARQAIGLLVKKNVVTRRQGHGTFVEKSTPTRTIALLFGPDLLQESAHFYRVLQDRLMRLAEASGMETRVYDKLNTEVSAVALPRNKSWKQYVNDARNYGIEGTIQVSPGTDFCRQKRGDKLSPEVIFEPGNEQTDGEFNLEDFLHQALNLLKARGHKNILFIDAHWGERSPMLPRIHLGTSFLRQKISRAESVAIQVPDVGNPWQMERIFFQKSLEFFDRWKRRRNDRPDALVVSDDIGMRGIAMALLKEGIQVPADLEVVCLGCEGIRHHYGFPVSRYELDVTALAGNLFKVLLRRIRGHLTDKGMPFSAGGRLAKDIF